MLSLLATQAAEVIKVTEPAWKEFLDYGMLGILVLLFLVKSIWEIWYGRKDRLTEKADLRAERAADRAARHSLAEAIEANTSVTRGLSTHIKDLVRWVAALSDAPPPPMRGADPDTPPAFPRQRPRDPESC